MPLNISRRRLLQATSAFSATTLLFDLASAAARPGSSAAHGRQPALFIGHGSPLNTLQDNAFTRELAQWGSRLGRPQAVLVVSAHWLTQGATGVQVQAAPRTLHDFGGFPPELHEIQYPAPGAPDIARSAAALVKTTRVLPTTQWGLDHGTWTVLRHLFPKADIPVFQLSIDYSKPAQFHLAVGRDLRALRELGVLVVGSGNVVHNLGALDRQAPRGPSASRAWAQNFDAAVAAALRQRDDKALVDYQRLPGAHLAVETPDHYFPFLYALGAAGPDAPAKTVFEEFQAGTISMRCVQFG